MKLVSAEIEEFEQGTWVADLVSIDAFDGSFQLKLGGDTWTGTKVSERFEFQRYHTRVVGGGGGLAKVLEDKYYSGSVSLQSAVQDICRVAGETFGAAQASAFLTTFERLRGPANGALDALAQAFTMIWWIGRDGMLNMQPARDVGPLATGSRIASEADSVLLIEPVAQLGGTYGDDAQPIRHIRWKMTPERFSAQIYFLPFIFRAPAQTAYSSLYSASVDRDNGDGTIDVIAAGRFGVTKVPLLCGVPGSKVEVRGGEQVTLGFFGGDPQKPFAVAMVQNTAATKEVARNTDSVRVTIPAGSFLISCSGSPAVGVLNPAPVDVDGTITSGSDRLKVGD